MPKTSSIVTPTNPEMPRTRIREEALIHALRVDPYCGERTFKIAQQFANFIEKGSIPDSSDLLPDPTRGQEVVLSVSQSRSPKKSARKQSSR